MRIINAWVKVEIFYLKNVLNFLTLKRYFDPVFSDLQITLN